MKEIFRDIDYETIQLSWTTFYLCLFQNLTPDVVCFYFSQLVLPCSRFQCLFPECKPYVLLYRTSSVVTCQLSNEIKTWTKIRKIRAELVAKQWGGLPSQLRVEKDCQHENRHDVMNSGMHQSSIDEDSNPI